MSKWVKGLVGCSLSVLAVSALGAGVASYSGAGLTPIMAITTFATNVFGGFGVEALKRMRRVYVERPGQPIDENHVILRNLRSAQLQALAEVARRFDRARATDPDPKRATKAADFSDLLQQYLDREQKFAETLVAADMREPDDADFRAMRAALINRAPDDFNAILSARHGAGPAIGRFRIAAEAAMLAELQAEVYQDIPATFESALTGQRDGADGWFALFIRQAAKQLREDAAFERIWQAEQTAAVRVLGEQTHTDIITLRDAIDGQTATLKAFGSQLGEIAADSRGTHTLMADIASRLDDTRGWLYVNGAFAPMGWLRFHAFNRAIPFQGREHEIADLQEFLHHDDPFKWWIVTAPGGAGKTRLGLELCLRKTLLDGWQAGFLQGLPPTPWRPRAPTLIIVDYAAARVETIRALAIWLARMAAPDQPVVRLLLLERQVDHVFWRQFLGSSGSDAGALAAHRYAEAPLALPDLSEDELWALVQPCPWRVDGRKVELDQARFYNELAQLDRRRRALVAMLLADAMAEAALRLSFTTLHDVLEDLVRNARDHHWPRTLDARNRRIGAAKPADVLIAAATMAGHIGNDEITTIETQLDAKISGDMLDECARAIGSPLYPDTRRLDGIQPDLIGEFFALQALSGDKRDGSPFPWLPELAWNADELAMAAFVMRARQNFDDQQHAHALSLIGITVPGKTESWWLDVLPILQGDPSLDLLSRCTIAHDRLIGPAATDIGAAGAFARLCWFASAQDRFVVPFSVIDPWVRETLALPVSFRTSPAVRQGLGISLFNTLNHAKAENALNRRDALLRDLRTLAADHPADAAVREELAGGLFNTLNHAKEENALDRRNALLCDLRTLAADHPADAAVRERLANGLYNTLNHAKEENALDRRDALLCDLRTLAADHPADAAVREQLARGLFNTLIDAKEENALDRRNALLWDLRTLAADHPADAVVRERLAKGLYNTLNHAKAENALDRRDALLCDLRTLAADHPADAAVREQLARGLFNTLYHAKAENALDRRDALLCDLRTLAADHPADAAVREALAKGLFNTLYHAKAENALDRRDALLCDLRTLAADHPADAAVREQLAKGLLNTLRHAKAENALDRRETLLRDLRTLAADHPADAAVRECFVKGLIRLGADLGQEVADEATLEEQLITLLAEIQALARAYPDDPFLIGIMKMFDPPQ